MNDTSDMKTCRACGLDYPLEDFYPSKVNKDGRVSYCKTCSQEKSRSHGKSRHFLPSEEGVKTCRICHRELPIASFHVAHHLVDGRATACKTCVNNKAKKRDKTTSHAAMKKWRDTHKHELLKYQRKWKTKNAEKVREDANNRYATDFNHRIAAVLRVRIHDVLKGKTKHEGTKSLLGCSIAELRNKLQSKFQPGMNWENHGQNGWHIDHILPCSSFDLTTIEEQRKCFHFSNLQPLWATDNRRKGAKIIGEY
jgi:hypothetical protein